MSGDGGLRKALLGRTFGAPIFDYLLIGGGLSLLWTGVLLFAPLGPSAVRSGDLALVLLLVNSTHFAASTVRLYAMPGAVDKLPRLTLVFPLVTFGVLSAAIAGVDAGGDNLFALYLTWSPYHFAAQAYGLAVMYTYRAGCTIGAQDKRLLRWVCLLPFFYAFLSAPGTGLDWLAPAALLDAPGVGAARNLLVQALRVLIFVAPVLLYAKVWRGMGRPMPLICLLVVVANGIWWVTLVHLQAFLWATVFHGIQYLAIVTIFHTKDRMALPENRHGRAYHSLGFYAVSLVLAYALFHLVPYGYVWAGFGYTQSLLLVVATINLHHFIVDAYIWRLGKGGGNRRIVDGAPA